MIDNFDLDIFINEFFEILDIDQLFDFSNDYIDLSDLGYLFFFYLM